MNDTKHTAQSPLRYSYSNPPASIGEARRRQGELDDDIVRMDADLKSVRRDDYENDDDYFDWKLRAQRALGHTQRERRFLLQWILKERQQLEDASRAHAEKRAESILRDLVDDFLRIATPYAPLFTKANLPKDFNLAVERRLFLVDFKLECSEFLGMIKSRFHKKEFPFRTYQIERRRVAEIVERSEREFLILKAFFRAHSGKIYAVNCSMQERSPSVSPDGTYFAGNELHMIRYLLGITEDLRNKGVWQPSPEMLPKYEEVRSLQAA